MKLERIVFIVCTASIIVSCTAKKAVIYKSKQVQSTTQQTPNPIIQVEDKKQVTADEVMSTEAYVNKFKDIAMEEMREYKIPASITLAQGILESSSGNSEFAKKSNNHFGIKCHIGWEGDQISHDDDEKGECFRKYNDPIISFKDHSLFLTSRSRYEKLFKLESNDYVSWARGLKQAGYATDKNYPAKLIALIERFKLYVFDEQVLGKSFKKIDTKSESVYVVEKGDTLYSISKKNGLTVEALKKLNDLNSNTINIGQTLLLN